MLPYQLLYRSINEFLIVLKNEWFCLSTYDRKKSSFCFRRCTSFTVVRWSKLSSSH